MQSESRSAGLGHDSPCSCYQGVVSIRDVTKINKKDACLMQPIHEQQLQSTLKIKESYRQALSVKD